MEPLPIFLLLPMYPTCRKQSLLALSHKVKFCENQLVVIVPKSNPGHVNALQDLSKPGLKLVTGNSSVPIGVYGMQVLDKLGKSAQYGATYEKEVKADIVSQEDTTKGVVSRYNWERLMLVLSIAQMSLRLWPLK